MRQALAGHHLQVEAGLQSLAQCRSQDSQVTHCTWEESFRSVVPTGSVEVLELIQEFSHHRQIQEVSHLQSVTG